MVALLLMLIVVVLLLLLLLVLLLGVGIGSGGIAADAACGGVVVVGVATGVVACCRYW